MIIEGQVGPQFLADGSRVSPRLGRSGEVILSELHGRFYEQAYRGNLFSVGCSVTALSANTITLTATTTPILAIWNPPGSLVNLVPLQAMLTSFANTLTVPVPPGAFVWATSIGNDSITTGASAFNRKSLVAAGGQAKVF